MSDFHAVVPTAGPAIPVLVRRNPRARRLSLSVDRRDGHAVLVLPVNVALARGLAFAAAKADWLAAKMAASPAPIPLAAGSQVPILGQPHQLCHVPGQRGGVRIDGGAIHIGGRPEYFTRRLTDWLKTRAAEEIAARAYPLAARIGRPIRRLAVRDPRSRWGSCTSDGKLAFSWRLVLAPAEVLTQVVAHEVAHLVEMNHSPAFWRLVETLAPGGATARDWLKRNGGELHRYR